MQDFGKLLLRLSVGGLMLFHGIHKVSDFEGTMKFMEGLLSAKGLPTVLAYGVWVGELVAPGLIIIGLFTRISGLIVAGTMAMAVYLAHMDDLIPPGGGVPKLTGVGGFFLELQALFFFGGLALACLGSGKIAIASGDSED